MNITIIIFLLKITGIVITLFNMVNFLNQVNDLSFIFHYEMTYLNTQALYKTSADILRLLQNYQVTVSNLLLNKKPDYNISNVYNMLDLESYKNYIDLSLTSNGTQHPFLLIYDNNPKFERKITGKVLQDIVNAHSEKVAESHLKYYQGIVEASKPLVASLCLVVLSFAMNGLLSNIQCFA